MHDLDRGADGRVIRRSLREPEAFARLPGIGLVRGTTDALGRPAIGVSMDDGENRIRTTLLFAPGSYELLGERESVLDGNSFGYPQGTLIGQASYSNRRFVDSVPRRSRADAHGLGSDA